MAHPLFAEVTAANPDLPPHMVKNLLITSQCISLARTTNLSKAKDFVPQVIGTSVAAQASPTANYQRLIRFFRDGVDGYLPELHRCIQDVSVKTIGNFPARYLKKAKQLVIDGTKWLIREDKVHFLTLCVVVEGVAIPIASCDLEKAGHSSQAERITFFDQVGEHFDLKGMLLLGDREYVGIEWFKSLKLERGIDFVVRLKKGIYHDQVNEKRGRSWQAMNDRLKKNKKIKLVSKLVEIGGCEYRYIIVRNPKAGHPDEDDFVYFLTSLTNAKYAAEQYSVRWQIEVTFRHLKSNGFNLEEMRVEGKEKKELMMAILSMVFAIMVAEGAKFYRSNPKARQQKKDHRRGVITLVHSTFRQGYSITLKSLSTLDRAARYLNRIFKKAKPIKWAHV